MRFHSFLSRLTDQRVIQDVRIRLPFAIPTFVVLIICMMSLPAAIGRERLVLQASGSFAEVPGTEYEPAKAYYNVTLPSRGWFCGVVVASPALFNGPDNNNPYYHRSSQFEKVGNTYLGPLQTTNIEQAPITTTRSAVIAAGGTYQAKVTALKGLVSRGVISLVERHRPTRLEAILTPPRWPTRAPIWRLRAARRERFAVGEATWIPTRSPIAGHASLVPA